jgi:hypothetical protein
MATLSRSAIALVAVVVAFAVIGGMAGCVDDGWYYASGEPPAIASPGGMSPECEVEVAAPSAAGANDPRAPHAPQSPRSAPAARTVGESPALTAVEPATFRTPTCVRNATD